MNPRIHTLLLALWLAAVCSTQACAEVDADALGKLDGYPVAKSFSSITQEKFMVGTFSNMKASFPHNTIRSGETAAPLLKAATALNLKYSFAGSDRPIQDYFRNNRITGLMILRGGEILFEEYQYDRKPQQLFTSFSMAKSVVSLAIGKALQEGSIRSLDDLAGQYVAELKSHPYGEATIRNLLRMSSGVKFNEDYVGFSDIQVLASTSHYAGVVAALETPKIREVAQGSRFKYASSESAVLALVVRGATGKSLADYVSEKIWKPLGAEADAAWMVDPQGVEIGFAYFNARLRDYGRLGAMLANDGAWNGKQIIPADYLREATDWRAQRAHSAHYGYQFWIMPDASRQFAMRGVHGQYVLVHPAKRLVLVQTAVTKSATTWGPNSTWAELSAVWEALVAATPDYGPATAPTTASTTIPGSGQTSAR
ncbi:serine hydrolase [soil metagenome]